MWYKKPCLLRVGNRKVEPAGCRGLVWWFFFCFPYANAADSLPTTLHYYYCNFRTSRWKGRRRFSVLRVVGNNMQSKFTFSKSVGRVSPLLSGTWRSAVRFERTSQQVYDSGEQPTVSKMFYKTNFYTSASLVFFLHWITFYYA